MRLTTRRTIIAVAVLAVLMVPLAYGEYQFVEGWTPSRSWIALAEWEHFKVLATWSRSSWGASFHFAFNGPDAPWPQ